MHLLSLGATEKNTGVIQEDTKTDGDGTRSKRLGSYPAHQSGFGIYPNLQPQGGFANTSNFCHPTNVLITRRLVRICISKSQLPFQYSSRPTNQSSSNRGDTRKYSRFCSSARPPPCLLIHTSDRTRLKKTFMLSNTTLHTSAQGTITADCFQFVKTCHASYD